MLSRGARKLRAKAEADGQLRLFDRLVFLTICDLHGCAVCTMLRMHDADAGDARMLGSSRSNGGFAQRGLGCSCGVIAAARLALEPAVAVAVNIAGWKPAGSASLRGVPAPFQRTTLDTVAGRWPLAPIARFRADSEGSTARGRQCDHTQRGAVEGPHRGRHVVETATPSSQRPRRVLHLYTVTVAMVPPASRRWIAIISWLGSFGSLLSLQLLMQVLLLLSRFTQVHKIATRLLVPVALGSHTSAHMWNRKV